MRVYENQKNILGAEDLQVKKNIDRKIIETKGDPL